MNKCIIFDFDCTLTYSNYFCLINSFKKYTEGWNSVLDQFNISINDLPIITTNWNQHKTQITNLIFGGPERLNTIISFFNTLKTNNFDIYISSRGNCDQIYNALQFFNLRKYITYTNANYNETKCVQENKDKFIESLKDKYDKIYYVDDVNDEHHTILFNNKMGNKYTYFGENIGLYPNKNGLDKEMINKILTTIGIHNNINQSGGHNIHNSYKSKYIKYKSKYINLKYSINKFN